MHENMKYRARKMEENEEEWLKFRIYARLQRRAKENISISRRCADHREHLWEQNLVAHGTVTVISRKALASRLGGPRSV